MTSAALASLFMFYSQAYNLPPNLLSSVCYVESKHDIMALHHDDGGEDSLGICQVKHSTSKWLGFKGTAQQLMIPATNIKYAALYLSRQMKRYKGNITKAVISYNRGNAKGLTRTKYSDIVLKKWRQLK